MGAELQQLKSQALQQMGGGQQLDPSALPDGLFKEQASRRVVLGLVLGEVIQQQNFQADPAKVRAAVEELAATYESPEDVIKWYYSNKEQLATVESTVIEDEVFDHIISEAKVNDKQVSYQEVIQPDSQAANLLVTAKRTFARVLQSVIAEYALGEEEIEAEIAELKSILAHSRR